MAGQPILLCRKGDCACPYGHCSLPVLHQHVSLCMDSTAYTSICACPQSLCEDTGCVHQRLCAVCARHTCVQTVMQYIRRSMSSQRLSCISCAADTAVDGLNLSLYGVSKFVHICYLYFSHRKCVIQHDRSWLQKDVVGLLLPEDAGDHATHLYKDA